MIVHKKRLLGLLLVFILLMGLALSACSYISGATPTSTPASGRDPVLEQRIEAQLEQMDSEAVPIYRQATIAMDAGDYAQAKQLYQQVLEMAPDFATAYRRLGYLESNDSNIDRAIELMQKALALEQDGYNQSALAMVLLQRAGPYDYQEAFDLASQAVQLIPEDEQAVVAWLLSASAVTDIEVMRQADERLLQVAPDNPLGHYEAGLLAANDGKWEKAERELLLSKKLGFSSVAVQSTLDSGISKYALVIRLVRLGVFAMGLWFFGFVFLFLAGAMLSKATLKTVATSQYDLALKISPKERRLRSIYRAVITILSVYFYISIPFVIVLLLLVVAGAFYVFTILHTLPIYLALVLVFMLIGSLYAILRSIFTKSREAITGKELSRSDAPALWYLVEEVARKMEVEPVHAIQLMPDAMIGVTERGSIMKKMRGRSAANPFK
ncbi:MAG: hypothetical protein C3F13_04065, partial [Anaerolineales bacterium]